MKKTILAIMMITASTTAALADQPVDPGNTQAQQELSDALWEQEVQRKNEYAYDANNDEHINGEGTHALFYAWDYNQFSRADRMAIKNFAPSVDTEYFTWIGKAPNRSSNGGKYIQVTPSSNVNETQIPIGENSIFHGLNDIKEALNIKVEKGNTYYQNQIVVGDEINVANKKGWKAAYEVAGLSSLLFEKFNGIHANQVKQLILDTAHKRGNLLNAKAALSPWDTIY